MRNSRIAQFVLPSLVALCFGLGACHRESQPEEQYFKLKGVVVSVDRPNMQIVVKHEAIPGFMSAMTMGYPVEDDVALKQLAPGDQISARVVVGAKGMWLDNIVIQKRSPATPPAPPSERSPAGLKAKSKMR
jgi:Cu/Ag efflux protein CusF